MDDASPRRQASTKGGVGEAFGLVSCHGTVLCFDRGRQDLKLRRAGQTTSTRDLQVAWRAGGDEEDRKLSLVGVEGRWSTDRIRDLRPIPYRTLPSGRDLIVLGKGEAFVTADDDLKVREEAKQCNAWEIFLLVSASELSVLDDILGSGQFLVTASGERYDTKRCGFGAGYELHIEGRRINLLDVADASDALRDCSLVSGQPGEAQDPPGGAGALGRADAPAVRRAVQVTPLGNVGNRALQFLVAENLRSRVRDASLNGISLPEWSKAPDARPPAQRLCVDIDWDHSDFDLPGLADCLSRGVVDTVNIVSYPFNVGLYPPLSTSRTLLPHTRPDHEAAGFGPNELVCNVRGGEVLRGAHKDYLVMPPRYYRSLGERSGLDLVFFGQLGDDPYSESLRSQCLKARFVKGKSPEHDFEVVRKSRHIAVGVSTFSWLAAWLSEAETIFLPISGMFSPVQYCNLSFIPLDDARYRYTLMPYASMVDLFARPDAFFSMQNRLADHMRPLSMFEVEQLCARALAFKRSVPRLTGFDNDDYLAMHPEVAARFYRREVKSPLDHYMNHGFRSGLLPRRFNEEEYLAGRPEAAMDIAAGRFSSPIHHAMSQDARGGRPLRTGWGP